MPARQPEGLRQARKGGRLATQPGFLKHLAVLPLLFFLAACPPPETGESDPTTPGGESDPPVSSALPTGGVFSAPPLVTLACEDASGGSGCATTHYTLNGSPPTTTSPAYTGPIRIETNATLSFFSVDNAGNSEAPREEAYVVDKAGPTTTAAPPAGTYTAPQTVTLACSDGDGAGCAKTYFTTGGSTPTTNSPVYANPISITGNRELKFFSVDLLGHAETGQTAKYVTECTITWSANRETSVNSAGGGYRLHYRATPGVTKSDPYIQAPFSNAPSVTLNDADGGGTPAPCGGYFAVEAFSAENPGGGALSAEIKGP